jgi:predicted secreted protein
MPWTSQLSLLIITVLLAQAPACGQESGTVVVTEKDGQFTAKDSDTGQVIRVEVGHPLVIKLPIVPAAGAVWHIAKSDALKQTEATRFVTKEGKPGARGEQVFQFVVEKPGKHVLLFTLDRGEELRGSCSFKLDAQK